MPRAAIDPKSVRRVFVRAPNWVGDLVMATGAFRRIRRAFPDAAVFCGLRPQLHPVLTGVPYFDGYLDLPKASSPLHLWSQARQLRALRCDLAIVLPNSMESGLLVKLAGIPKRLGYRQSRPLLMNYGLKAEAGRKGLIGMLRRRGPRRVPKPMPLYYRELLDVIDLPPEPDHPELFVSDGEREWADRYLEERGYGRDARLVLLNTGAAYGASKFWLPDRFAELATRFRDLGMAPMFLAGPTEVDMVHDIARRCDVKAATDPVIPLDKLRAVIDRAELMVTTDTGPRHYAVALGKPVVTLMGPTDRRYTDYLLERQNIIQKDLPCVPCQRKICPLVHHDCMKAISVDEVMQAALALHG